MSEDTTTGPFRHKTPGAVGQAVKIVLGTAQDAARTLGLTMEDMAIFEAMISQTATLDPVEYRSLRWAHAVVRLLVEGGEREADFESLIGATVTLDYNDQGKISGFVVGRQPQRAGAE